MKVKDEYKDEFEKLQTELDELIRKREAGEDIDETDFLESLKKYHTKDWFEEEEIVEQPVGLVEIGAFDVITGKIILSDPCYKRGTWCMIEGLKALPGKWRTFVYRVDEDDWGNRVGELIAAHEDYLDSDGPDWHKDQSWEAITGEVGVDSGQAGIFDNSIYPAQSQGPEFDRFYEECGEHTLDHNKGNCGVGEGYAVTASGYGDGGYEAQGLYSENGRDLVAVRIIFITDEDEDECEQKVLEV